MLLPMATSFSHFDHGPALNNLRHFFMNTSYIERHPGLSSKQSSLSCFNAQKFFQKTYRTQLKFKQQRHHLQYHSQNQADYSDNIYSEEREEDVSRATLIWRAIKLPIYSVALVPLTVGAAAAYLQTGILSARRYFVLLVSSVLIITWLNLSNDVYDFDTGADKNKKESVVNLVGSRVWTLLAAYSLLVLGFIGLTWTSLDVGNTPSILLLTSAIICGYIYQCPPFRLSYQGLGEPLCFAAFGPFATTAFYLLLGSTSEIHNVPFTGAILSVSLLVGLTTTLILFCSHFHQVEGDRAVGKMSPLVRLGTERGSVVVKVAVQTLYSLTFALGLSRALPWTCIDKEKIFMAKYYCVRLHGLFGAALATGLVAARMLIKIW
ncbi:2-carboxy-1,4-naphthoquinone phytyltransferase, chloroplastic-like isoform X2 [Pistacia vera]|uniref:2-carboxy-1,4-naphthoquinone phytyltransferase, chloroplastic-like isoform X2 n=1 Tax=Pistacia vera TaxID=55513 RepID=UPI001263B897|nr:2-carboxy-1,4-naphthoquinone phytyltransferase, chloroplastic-like isoform X2 [Pistacia vera]XP_031259381.1 2-carboxy-1,4-naphthoquinone phytyltransferase, chloroplastic-like isoform X2 [Pistacia vera]